MYFTKEQTSGNLDYIYEEFVSGDDTMCLFPLITEYIVPLSDKVKWIIAPSFTLSIYKDFGGEGTRIIHINDDKSNKPLHTSTELSTGFYFPFKHFMLQQKYALVRVLLLLKVVVIPQKTIGQNQIVLQIHLSNL